MYGINSSIVLVICDGNVIGISFCNGCSWASCIVVLNVIWIYLAYEGKDGIFCVKVFGINDGNI